MKLTVRCLVFAVVVCASANATILTFDISSIYSNYMFPNAYGDNAAGPAMDGGSHTFGYLEGNGWTPDIAVDYFLVQPATGERTADTIRYQEKSYGDFRHFARSDAGLLAEIVLTAAPGWLVRLNTFDLAAVNPVNALLTVGEVQAAPALPKNYHYSYLPQEPVVAQSVTIRFGHQSAAVAIDNVNFDQVPAPVAKAIVELPEPGTMLAAGMGLVAIARLARRRRGLGQG